MFMAVLTLCTWCMSPHNSTAQEKLVNTLGMEFVYIAPGSFTMGSPETDGMRKEDERQRSVALPSGYYMQTTEVTQGQWKAVMGRNPSQFKDCGADCPVENVSWDDALLFISKLNARDHSNHCRLPTEAEWEYACRAGGTTRFSWGDDPDCSKANYGNSPLSDECKTINPGKTAPVGSYAANPWGLYDMHGNVWEWCADVYVDYTKTAGNDLAATGPGAHRVVRGGAYFDPAESCRTANRCWDPADYRVQDIGFRLVCLPRS